MSSAIREFQNPTQELDVSDYMPILLLIMAVLVENVSDFTAPIAGLRTSPLVGFFMYYPSALENPSCMLSQ